VGEPVTWRVVAAVYVAGILIFLYVWLNGR